MPATEVAFEVSSDFILDTLDSVGDENLLVEILAWVSPLLLSGKMQKVLRIQLPIFLAIILPVMTQYF